MAITLAELADIHQDRLVSGFVNEIVTDSYILASMTFDDCLTASGTSNMVYSYNRVKTPMSAKFRALNSEPEKSKPEVEQVTTKVAILSDAWDLDRVAKAAAEDLYELYLEESKNAIIRKFNKTVVNGDTDTETDGFDGLSKALKGSSTELQGNADLSTVTKESALAFAGEMDELLGSLMRDPDVLIVSPATYTRINAVCRVLGISNVTMDGAGHRVSSWDGVRIEQLRDGALTGGDIYAVCFGMDGFHGVTLAGQGAVSVHLPDWNAPGAVKTGDAEMVCGCALKKTKAAGVLRAPAAY